MNLAEYAKYDGVGLAELVAKKDVSSRELALTALEAIKAGNPVINAVVETYDDCIDGLDETRLGNGPFRGVPFLIKDVFGHEKGRKIEFGSRLCKGMTVEAGTYFVDMLKAAGVNILGRSAAPEYSMSATTESVMFGNTSNPWKQRYSAGGSSGGAQAAVTSGIVPLAHGSDIGGSIRIPASLCGGVGLKPSRGRVSIGPVVDEGGFGFSVNFVQARTVRDIAAMLDCVSIPQPGDPQRNRTPRWRERQRRSSGSGLCSTKSSARRSIPRWRGPSRRRARCWPTWVIRLSRRSPIWAVCTRYAPCRICSSLLSTRDSTAMPNVLARRSVRTRSSL